MPRFTALLLAFLLFLPASLSHAAELRVEKAWARASMGAGTTGAVFLEITNDGGEAVTLTGAGSPVAGRAELHSHQMSDGVMRMRQVDRIEIGAGQRLSFQPGGYHIMLFGMKRRLTEGERFQASLITAAGESLSFEVMVMAPSFMGHEDGHGSGHDQMNRQMRQN